MMKTIPRDFIELLLAKIDLVDLISLHIPLRKKSASNYFACCPFHQEKSASFSVSQPKQFYYCFGCGAHGNAIDFTMKQDRLSFVETIEKLARMAGMTVPNTAHQASKKETLPELYTLMEQVTAHYYQAMSTSQRAIEYLKKRGISGAIAKQFSLGYASPAWNQLLDNFGKKPEDISKLMQVGLIIKKNEGGYYDRFRDRILFPIHNDRGRIIGFGGRIIDEGEPKYLNSPETILFQKGHEWYGLYHALKAHRNLKQVLIVEGYMDVIALYQHGITYAIATLGTATTAHHLQRIFRYTSDLIFCFDGDQAGRRAAWRALEILFPLIQDGITVRFLFLPEGEDPDSMIRKEGSSLFEKRIENALSLATFFFQTLSQENEMTTLEGRARFAAQAMQTIRQVEAPLLHQLLLEEVSKRARIDVHALSKKPAPHPVSIAKKDQYEPASSALAAPLRRAISLLIQHPQLVNCPIEPLPNLTLNGISFLTDLFYLAKQSPNITVGALIEAWRGKPEERWIAELAYEKSAAENEQVIKNEWIGAIRQLQQLELDQTINTLIEKGKQTSLSDTEKQTLSLAIAKKKAWIEQSP